MFCPHCGTHLEEGTKFCTECGMRLEPTSHNDTWQADASTRQGPTTPVDPNPWPSPSYAAPSYEEQRPPQPGPTAVPVNPQGPLNPNRDIVTYVLLSIVTCGIYSYWTVYTMAQDANVLCAGDNEETPGLLVFILLNLVTCGIYSYYWLYKLANRLQASGPRYGLNIYQGGSDVLLWLILGIFTCGICFYVAMHLVFKNMNELCAAYNREHGYVWEQA